MSNRTFKQLGQGYSNVPATVIVKVDGETVYMGPVPTVNEPVPTDFTWGRDHDVALKRMTPFISSGLIGLPLRRRD